VKKTYLTLFAFLCFAVAGQAQEISAAIGFSSLTAPSAANVTGNFSPQSIGGGLFPTISASYVTGLRLGIEGEVSWRATQNLYQGFENYRPIFYDVNAIFAPKLGNRAILEVVGGLGAESVRFYGVSNCGFAGCTNFVSANHLMGDVGAGLRLYATKNFFVRPEARWYFVRNNFDFSGAHATRAGVSLGFTF
jgi:hypothetical protein